MITISERPSLLSLAEGVSTLTQTIVNYLEETNREAPNFTTSSSEVPLTKEYESMRNDLNTAALDLLRLVNGPKVVFRDLFAKKWEMAAWQVALQFDYFNIVPLEGSITLQQLAAKAGMDECRTLQVMRFLVTQRAFKEIGGNKDDESLFEHTAVSATIAREPLLKPTFIISTDELFRAATSASDSIRNSPFEVTAEGSPFTIHHGDTIYKWCEKDPARAMNFAKSMEGITILDGQTSKLHDEFDWMSLPAGTVVDVGGGSGYVSLSLAKEFPHLNFIIQDVSPKMLSQGRKLWTGEVESRVTFMQYDYFQPQPVQNATAFFSRRVTHNLTDQDTIRFFRSFIPALELCRPGTPLLIIDVVIPEPGQVSAYEEHRLRHMDLAMWAIFNARERTEKDFRKLLAQADSRLELVKVHSQGILALIEVQLSEKGPVLDGRTNP